MVVASSNIYKVPSLFFPALHLIAKNLLIEEFFDIPCLIRFHPSSHDQPQFTSPEGSFIQFYFPFCLSFYRWYRCRALCFHIKCNEGEKSLITFYPFPV